MVKHVRASILLVPFLLSCGSSPPAEHVKVSADDVTLVENDFEIYLTRVTMDEWKAEVRIFCPTQVLDNPDVAYQCLGQQARVVADILDPPKENTK